MGRRLLYLGGVAGLAGVSLLLAALIVLGELRDDYALGGGALGAVLVAYGLIVLFLRKAGYIGPRRSEGK